MVFQYRNRRKIFVRGFKNNFFNIKKETFTTKFRLFIINFQPLVKNRQKKLVFLFLIHNFTDKLGNFLKESAMKHLLMVIITAIFALSATGQVKQDVIASAGGYNSSPDNSISISWTLGETIVPTYTSPDGTLILTHGFQQEVIITAIEENPELPVTVTIYPNPASESVNIKFESVVDKQINLQILDGEGRLVKIDKIEVSVLQKTINLQDLPAGIYFMRLVKGNLVNVYKIVKL